MLRILPLLIATGCALEPAGTSAPEGARFLTSIEHQRILANDFGQALPELHRLPELAPTGAFTRPTARAEPSVRWVEAQASSAEYVAAAAALRPAWSATFFADTMDLPETEHVSRVFGDLHDWVTFKEPGRWQTPLQLPAGHTEWTVDVAAIRYLLWCEGEEPPPMPDPSLVVSVDGVEIGRTSLPQINVDEAVQSWTFTAEPGEHTLTLDIGPEGMMFVMLRDVIVRPTGASSTTVRWPCLDEPVVTDTCVVDAIREIVTPAWRRPPDAEQLLGLHELFRLIEGESGSARVAFEAVVEAVLLSPRFAMVFDASPQADPWTRAGALAGALGIAPDEELLDCAARGGLDVGTDPCGLDAQLERLLSTPAATRAFAQDFVQQWLGIDKLELLTRSQVRFGDYNLARIASMRGETERLLLEALADDLPLPSLLDGGTSWLNEGLARLYDTEGPGVNGPFARLAVPGPRAGLLTHASVLTATIPGDRTSFIQRGVFVADRFACLPPDPPPAALPGLDTALDPVDALLAHSSKPGCVECHATIDPLGLVLEQFDAVGAWLPDARSDLPVAELPDGTRIEDVAQLAAWLNKDGRFATCLTEHLIRHLRARPADGELAEATALLANLGGHEVGLRTVVRRVVRDAVLGRAP